MDHSILPKFIYHLVPKKFFNDFVDNEGSYDCRNKKEWGRNSAFIHTTPTKKQLKEKVVDANFDRFPASEKYLLLEIATSKIKAKITEVKINNSTYHHIWGSLPADSYRVINAERDLQSGRFNF